MREGEALALKWTNYANGELFVERSVWRRIGKVTKTDDPRRVAVEPLAVILEEQRRWLLESQHPGLESGLIFPASPKHARAAAKKRASMSAGRLRTCCERLESTISFGGRSQVGARRKRRRSTRASIRRSGWRRESASSICCFDTQRRLRHPLRHPRLRSANAPLG